MKQRILIVDDEFGLADVVAEILAENGYEVAIAINGRLGLASVEESRPALILLDIMMPVLDGPAMLRLLRANPDYVQIPVVMMTALPEALSESDMPLYQAALLKPFTPDALLKTMQSLLAQV
jgi:DNA-binding response OmpR family regulator